MWFPPFATNAVMNKHARARTHTHHCTRTSTPTVSRVRENTEVKGTHTGTSGIWYTPTCGLRVCQFPTGGGSSYPNFTERGNLSESKPEWLQNPSSLWINWGTRYKTDTQSRRSAQKEGWKIGSTYSVRRLEGEQWLPKVGKRREKSLSCVWLFATPWTVANQVPPSMGFSRQEYWSGLPSPGDLPDPGSNLGLPHCRQPLYHLSRWEVLYKWLMLLLFSFHCFLNSTDFMVWLMNYLEIFLLSFKYVG